MNNTTLNKQSLESLAGIVERITYHNADNGFCVLRVKVKGQRDLITVISNLPVINAGEFIHASGEWFSDKSHGLQFKASFIKVTPPDTLEGLEKYLGSGMIKGIGPIYAKKLITAFGEKVFDIIEQSPHLLKNISGIGAGRQEKILKGWADQKAIREIMLFLHSNGISTTRAVRIYKTYGGTAIQIITDNPYRLAQDIRGIGFISADQIAEKMGIAKDSMVRAQAGISYALTTALEDGHCGYPQDQLIASACELLEIEQPLIEDALSLELANGTVIQETVRDQLCIFLKGLAAAEEIIAKKIIDLSQGSPPWQINDIEKAIEWVQDKLSITLSQSQQQAIRKGLSSKVFIITGGPGVGKTTLVKSLLTILESKAVDIALAAPTGRAAKRLYETTGLRAKTLHRLLNIKGGDHSSSNSPELNCDLLIVDETSMVDSLMMHKLMKALPERAALFLVGDVDQLPSVGPGQVLKDLLDSEMINSVRLTEVFRQAAQSQIITVAHSINRGIMPNLKGSNPTSVSKEVAIQSDFYFIPAETPEQACELILKLVTNRIPNAFNVSALHDIQVLCPMTRGVVGTRNLNSILQQALHHEGQPKIQRFGMSFQFGDKVMQLENNYEKDIYNGDIGLITDINSDESELIITFDGRPIVYEFNELDEITLAYATTVHKSQGSEYPVVIVPVLTQHYAMLQKNLIYTAVTRGKKLVILVGQEKALWIALKKGSTNKRWTLLKEKLLSFKNSYQSNTLIL